MLEIAQNNFDWVENVVILVLIALSVFGSVAKALIKKFSPKENDERKRSRVEPRTIRLDEESKQPDRPVAQPLPPRPRPIAARPVADRSKPSRPRETIQLPEPLRDVLSELVPELVPPRPPERRPERPVKQPPKSVPTLARPVESRTVSRRSEQSIQTVGQQRATPKKPKTKRRQPEDRLGHLESKLTKSPSGATPASEEHGDPFSLSRRPSRDALRYAIVMKEVLGPPLALRDGNDHLA